MGSNENHFNVSLIVRDKVTRQCPQATAFLKRSESRSGIEPRSFSLTALPLGQTGSGDALAYTHMGDTARMTIGSTAAHAHNNFSFFFVIPLPLLIHVCVYGIYTPLSATQSALRLVTLNYKTQEELHRRKKINEIIIIRG